MEGRDAAACRIVRGIEGRRRADQLLQSDLDRVLRAVVRHHERKEEVVPGGDEREEADKRDDRSGQRKRDVPEDPPLAGAVDPCRCEQILRDRRREVDVGQVDPEGEEPEREDERPDRAVQTELVDLEEQRQHERGRRHDHHNERDRKQHTPPDEVRERERVAGRNRREDRQRSAAERVDRGVLQPDQNAVAAVADDSVKGVSERAQTAECEWRLGEELAVGLRRREKQPDDRHEEERREEQQDQDRDEVHRVSPGERHQSTSNSLPRQTRRPATMSPSARRTSEIAAASLNSSYWDARNQAS
jgi:hypothetical protein